MPVMTRRMSAALSGALPLEMYITKFMSKVISFLQNSSVKEPVGYLYLQLL